MICSLKEFNKIQTVWGELCRGLKIFRRGRKIPMMIITVWLVCLAHILQMVLRAFVYLYVAGDPIVDMESALYFSASSFTTVGFGDIFLSREWRLLSSIEAANGFILFGWSTAFIFEIISKLYKDEKIRKYEE